MSSVLILVATRTSLLCPREISTERFRFHLGVASPAHRAASLGVSSEEVREDLALAAMEARVLGPAEAEEAEGEAARVETEY